MSFSTTDLNPEQREAVETIDGPLLLLAGAGTGKTRVITYRIAHLLASGIAPEHVLAVTFTNKAANEMRERLAALVAEEQAEALTIGTFHAFGMKMLRKHIQVLGYSRNFAVANEAFQVGYVGNIMAELGYETRKSESAHENAIGAPRDCLAAIHRAKTALLTPDDLRDSDDPLERRIADVYEQYQTGLRNMSLVDFEDLLILVLRLWEEKPDLLEKHHEQFRYIMIDEYQDTNAVQFRMMATLAGKRGNICVVGDDDQSIYGWRGADITNILSFDSHFPGAKVIRLEQNYRSTRTILDAANHVIAHNHHRHAKKLWSDKSQGAQIMTVRVQDEVEESRLLVELIKERKADGRRSFGDFAVLYRSNHQSRSIEEALMRAKIPYTLVGGRSFFERKEVIDLISMLRVVCNPRDDLSLLQIINVPPRGVGQKSLERLRGLQRITNIPLQKLMVDESFLSELVPPAPANLQKLDQCLKRYRRLFAEGAQSMSSLVDGVLRDSGYFDALGRMYKPRENALERRENLLEFVNTVADYEKRRGSQRSLSDLLDALSLRDANDRREGADLEGNSVTLMTVHAAKGLEFPVVLGIGMEHGLFPHQNAIADGSIEEERRLFYVAVTRAREELVLTHAGKRRVRGASVKRRPSTFLHELPEELVDIREGEDALRPATQEEADDIMSQMLEMFS